MIFYFCFLETKEAAQEEKRIPSEPVVDNNTVEEPAADKKIPSESAIDKEITVDPVVDKETESTVDQNPQTVSSNSWVL